MDSKESSDGDLRERKKFLPPGETSKQEETPVCGLSAIKTWLSDERVVRRIRLVYRSIILFLLIVIGVIVVIERKQIEQLGRSLISPPQCGPPCPRYWIGYEGRCYYLSKEKRDWISSHHYCSSHGASLARIEKEEMDFVMRLKGKDIYWIGLRRVLSKGWTWADGENATLLRDACCSQEMCEKPTRESSLGCCSLDESSIQFCGMEVTGGGDCAFLDNAGKAIASGCHTKLPWICSKPAVYTTQEATDT